MTEPNTESWRRCSTCKKPIGFKSLYWVCNVSTCNRKRTGLVFCEVSCWDAHVPMMNHRESWAEERQSPSPEEWARILAGEDKPIRKPRAPKEDTSPQEAQKPTAPKVVIRRAKPE